MLRRFLFAVLVSGCSDYEVPENEEVPPPVWTEEAAWIAVDEWSTRLGLSVPDDLPEIRWFWGHCLDYPSGSCPYGRFFIEEEEVHLSLAVGDPRGTALAHEMLHWTMYSVTGCGDPDHESPAWQKVGEVEEATGAANR